MAVSSDRDAVICHRRIAFLDEVRRHVRMLRARYAIALASDIAAIESHGRGAGFDLAAVIGVVTYADEIHHFVGSITVGCCGATPRPLDRSLLLFTQPLTGPVFFEF